MKELNLKEIQTVSLSVLKKIISICEQEGINYSLAYGTLLGAIRHKGFIPWDDDIDIMMARTDYERFINYFEKHAKELLPLELLNMSNTSNYPHMITRISDNRYVLDVTNEKDYGLGIFVDIYVFDGAGNTFEDATKLLSKTKKYPSLIFLAERKYLHVGNTSDLRKILIKPLAFLYAKVMGTQYFVNKLLSNIDIHHYNNFEYVACLIWASDSPLVIKKTNFEDTIIIPFEDIQARVPREYDKILKGWYGDYMTPPPVDNRECHHLYKAYIRK